MNSMMRQAPWEEVAALAMWHMGLPTASEALAAILAACNVQWRLEPEEQARILQTS